MLPHDVLGRRKSPYPKTHNPAYLAAVRHRLLDILDDPTSPLLQLVNADAVRAIARSAQSGVSGFGPAWFGQLMGDAQLFAYLIQVNIWLREYRVLIR